MFGTIIHRQIFFELLKVFLMALTALTGMFLIAGLIQEATQRGLTPTQILLAIPLLIPNTLPFTIPATTLFATCVVYGRMSADNEVLVLKAAGVNILTLLWPAVLVGIMTCGLTVYLYYDTIPRSQQILRQRFLNEAEDVLYGQLRRERCLRHSSLPYVLFVREVQGKTLVDVIFKKRAKQNGKYIGYDLIARAREARLRVDRENNLIHVDMESCTVFGDIQNANNGEKTDLIGAGNHQTFQVPLPESIFGKNPKERPSSLTTEQLLERREEVVVELNLRKDRADEMLQKCNSFPPQSALYELHKSQHHHLMNMFYETARMVRNIDVEYQLRLSLPVGCLCFVLIGVPVGIWASRSDYLSIFVVCFLPTVFVYYPLFLSCCNLAKDGKLPIVAAVWAADAILGFVSLFLIWRLMRR